MTSLRMFQCQICFYSSNNKYDVETHQEKIHNNPINAISQFGKCKQGHGYNEGSESIDDEKRYKDEDRFSSDDKSESEIEDSEDEDNDNVTEDGDSENEHDGESKDTDSGTDDEDCEDDDDVGSYESLAKLFKAFSDFMIPWYEDFEVYCGNIRSNIDEQEKRKECIAKCIRNYAKVKCQMIEMCELVSDRIGIEVEEDSTNDDEQMVTDDESDEEEESEEEDETEEEDVKVDQHNDCCMKKFLSSFEKVFENNKWAKKELCKMEEMEQLAIDMTYFDEEIDAMKRKKYDENSDTSEDDDSEMGDDGEHNLPSKDGKFKESVLKLRKALRCYELEKKSSDYFRDSSKCSNDTMRVLGFFCNMFLNGVEKNGDTVRDEVMRTALNKMRDREVSIQRKREMLTDQQVGDGIMMRLKNELMPILIEDLVNN